MNKSHYVPIYKTSWKKNGNCFVRAIAHQLCYNESHYGQIRQSAVKEVIENPERYKNFVTEGLDEYVSSLSANR